MSRIYLDNNATTRIDPIVMSAIEAIWSSRLGNPESRHDDGASARRAIARSRSVLLDRLGAISGTLRPDTLLFTSGATESNHLAVAGLLTPRLAARNRCREAASTHPTPSTLNCGPDRSGARPTAVILIGATEHASMFGAVEAFAGDCLHDDRNVLDQDVQTVVIERLPVDAHGRIDPAGLELRLTSWRSRLSVPASESTPTQTANLDIPLVVCVQLANQETGVVQPIARLAAIAHSHGALIHTDATQAVGKVSVSFRELGVDSLAFSGHKFHGPPGIGGLVVRSGVTMTPLLRGGHQQGGLRAGTEPTALIVGLAAALEQATEAMPIRTARLAHLRDTFEADVRQRLPSVVVIGPPADRLPQTSCLAFPGHDRQALQMALDLAGVSCSTGSACASGSSEPSPVLNAMAAPDAILRSALRWSVGADTTEAEVAEAAKRLAAVVSQSEATARPTASSRRRIPAHPFRRGTDLSPHPEDRHG